MVRISVRFFYILTLIWVAVSGCQKDESVKKTTAQPSDSVKVNTVSAPGNYLASKGTLTVKIKDSTYAFNAEQDSIAFVNIAFDGEEYYGLTAINKAHTVSFGISSSGVPIDDIASYVSGAQLLLKVSGKTNLEYTLIPGSLQQKFGTISIEKYNQDATLAKGTFDTFLATGSKYNSPDYEVTGSFELKVK